jgi:hypothetical protein
MSRISVVRDIPIRRARRDGLLMWPDRAISRDPAINLAEVERALSRPARSKCTAPALSRAATQTAKADRRRTPNYTPVADIGLPPTMPNGRKMTFAEAGRLLGGISAAAAYKKIHKFGWAKAITMSRPQSAPLTNKH